MLRIRRGEPTETRRLEAFSGVSRALNAANLLLLGTVIMIPWATASLAAALGDSAVPAARQAVLLYAAVIVACALTWGLLYQVLGSNPNLLDDPSHARGFLADRAGALIALGTTAIAAAIGYLCSPIAGAILFAIVPVIFAVASEGFIRDEQSGATK